jgi:hypothetical protein
VKTYRSFATTLETLLRSDQTVRLRVDGYMPLSLERIGDSAEGRARIAIAHTSVQNGDLMRDPEMVFELQDDPTPTAPGLRRISRADWSRRHRDFKGWTAAGDPSMLELDARSGGTVLVPVAIIDPIAEPVSYQNDFVGVLQEVYEVDDAGRRTHVRPKLKTALRSFARTWFRNLRAQGFLGRGVKREILA